MNDATKSGLRIDGRRIRICDGSRTTTPIGQVVEALDGPENLLVYHDEG